MTARQLPQSLVKIRHHTATDHRNQAFRLVSDLVTAALSDLEVARRVGRTRLIACNIRRWIGANVTGVA